MLIRRPRPIPSSRCQENRRVDQRRNGTLRRWTTCSRSGGARPGSNGSGGARRDRTDDLLLAKQALSQLSYGPVSSRFLPGSAKPSHQVLVGLERFELSTSRLSSARSNQLSYRPGKRGGRPNEERETKAAVSRRHIAEPIRFLNWSDFSNEEPRGWDRPKPYQGSSLERR
jgi:hypothetical protein